VLFALMYLLLRHLVPTARQLFQRSENREERRNTSPFEFARPAPPRQPRWGSRTVHRARHLFCERCRAKSRTMAHTGEISSSSDSGPGRTRRRNPLVMRALEQIAPFRLTGPFAMRSNLTCWPQ
jgi:hypothetical protein